MPHEGARERVVDGLQHVVRLGAQPREEDPRDSAARGATRSAPDRSGPARTDVGVPGGNGEQEVWKRHPCAT